MPIDLQTVVIGVTPGTRKEYIPLAGGGNGILPVARIVMSGAFDLDGSGAGDTSALTLTSTLPENICWQLTSLFHTIQFADIPTNAFSLAQFELAISADGGPPTDLFYQMAVAPVDVSAKQAVTLGNKAATGGIWAPGVGESPFANITFVQAGDIYRFRLAGPDTTDSDGALTFYWSWLGYTFEQMRGALLHTGLIARVP